MKVKISSGDEGQGPKEKRHQLVLTELMELERKKPFQICYCIGPKKYPLQNVLRHDQQKDHDCSELAKFVTLCREHAFWLIHAV